MSGAVLDLPCPKCGAKPGQLCEAYRNARGGPHLGLMLDQVHPERRRATAAPEGGTHD